MKLAIVVEGQTEERFVKEILEPHLLEHGVGSVPILIGSGRPQGGGHVNVKDLVEDLCNALDQYDAATSLVDLYEFAGRDGRNAKRLEKVVRRKVMKRHDAGLPVRPHVQIHEFESLLFSDPGAFRVIRTIPGCKKNEIIEKLRRIRIAFPNPEDINDGEHSAPSKRLKSIVPNYRKKIHGIAVARETGIGKISRKFRGSFSGNRLNVRHIPGFRLRRFWTQCAGREATARRSSRSAAAAPSPGSASATREGRTPACPAPTARSGSS